MPRPHADSLSALFSPRSVAVVGASDDRDRLSGRPIRYLLEAGYRGSILPVNARRDRVQGLPAYASVGELPAAPDVAMIIVSADAVVASVRECVRRGVRGIYLLSGGFAETGAEGVRAQAAVRDAIAGTGVRLLGPNCLGAFNARLRFFGTFATSLERALPAGGPVAVASQSGAYGQHLAYLLGRRGVGVGYLVTTGNELDVGLGECIEWLVRQPDVSTIVAYAEGIRDGEAFVNALEAARAARKPVVLLKVGSSEVGARAVASHTAALAGADAVHAAVLRQYGAWRADSTDQQVDVAYLATRTAQVGPRLGIVTLSGGFGVQSADAAAAAGLDVAPLPEPVRGRLEGTMPGASIANPFDVTGQAVNDLGLLERAVAAVAEPDAYDVLMVHLTTAPMAAALVQPMLRALLRATERFRRVRPVVVVMVAPEATVRAFEDVGLVVFEDSVRAVRALGALVAVHASFGRAQALRAPPAGRADGYAQTVATPSELPAGALDEVRSKEILRAAGLPVPGEALVHDADAAVDAARRAAAAVAMKIVSPDIVHKTEIGGVLLDVAGDVAVRAGFATLMDRGRRNAPHARIDGVLVAPMLTGGVETILGVSRDPTFGPVMMFGHGGVHAEHHRDLSFRRAPLDRAEARAMISETRVAALFEGWRGAPPCDVDALVDALVALSRLACAPQARIASIDVNPFVVLPRGRGAAALDAVVVLGDAA